MSRLGVIPIHESTHVDGGTDEIVDALDLRALIYANAVVGIEWNQATDTWKRIDEDGNEIFLDASFFNAHPTWGNIRRCTLNAAGAVNHYGQNPRGDGLDLSGADGRVMVEYPAFYVKASNPSANVYRRWISPIAKTGFELAPWFVQRGGTIRAHAYAGAYEAVLANDNFPAHVGTQPLLHSFSGQQPWTGYFDTRSDGMTELPFDSGSAEFTIGETLTGATGGAVGTVVDWIVTGGTWLGTNAAGEVWLKQQTAVDYQVENLNGSLAGANCASATGVQTNMPLAIGNARTYAENIGSARWGITSIWGLSARQLLLYIELASGNSQAVLGRGIVDKAGGVGFAGEETGHDSADTNIGVNGTGAGTGTNGLTPVVWRGLENPFGNVWKFIDGYNAIDGDVGGGADVKYRLINRDGSGTFADALAGGNYEESSNLALIGDGYISNVEYEDLLKYLFIAKAVAGSTSTYLADYFWAHDAAEVNILLFGGAWADADRAGVAFLYSMDVAARSNRDSGGRLEFV